MSLSSLPDPYGWPVDADPFTALPPSYRSNILIAICIQCAAVGALVWDLSNSVHFDWNLLSKSNWMNRRTAGVNIAYLTSRWCALIFALCAVTSITTMQDNCTVLPRVYSVFVVLTVATTSWIFAVRVIALWNNSLRLIAGLGLIVLVEVGFACASLATSGGQHPLPISPFCVVMYGARPWLAGVSASILAFDTLVAFLTFYKLSRTSHLSPLSLALKDSTPALSKLLVKQGIVYYLVACSTNLIALVLFTVDLPPEKSVFHLFWTIPGLAIQSMMACKVFRSIREELQGPDEAMRPAPQQISFTSARADRSVTATPISKREFFGHSPTNSISQEGITFTRQTTTIHHGRVPAELLPSQPRRFSVHGEYTPEEEKEVVDLEKAERSDSFSTATDAAPFSQTTGSGR